MKYIIRYSLIHIIILSDVYLVSASFLAGLTACALKATRAPCAPRRQTSARPILAYTAGPVSTDSASTSAAVSMVTQVIFVLFSISICKKWK